MHRFQLSQIFSWGALCLFLVLGLFLAISGETTTADGQDRYLFEPVAYTPPVADRVSTETEPFEVIREQHVTIRPAAMDSRSADIGLQINLFDDELITAVESRVDTYDNGGSVWVGTVDGIPYSDVSIGMSDGVMVGSFNLVDRLYRIQPVAEDSEIHVIQEVSFVNAIDLEPVPVTIDMIVSDGLADSLAHMADQTAVATDDGSVVDVYVAYTPAARSLIGGSVAMATLINTAVSETNTGYDNSGVQFDMNLVGYSEVSYTELSSSWDLYRLRLTNDGHMDTIHTLRNATNADFVVLIADMESSYCGLAYFMTSLSTSFSPYAFGLVDYTCATGYYSFGHEIGHNMGMAHDIQVVESGSSPNYPMYDYAYGYYDPDGDFRSIMAYSSYCPGFCPRVNRWSNPNIAYNGQTAGTATANNCQALADNAEVVANFRTSASRDILSAQIGLADTVGVAFVPDASATYMVYLPLLAKPLPVPCVE